MGILDRLHDTVTGVAGALQAPLGLVKDLTTAPWDDDINGNPMTVIYDSLTKRGGQAMANLLGPEEGVGAIVGALPAGVRAPARNVITPIQGTMEAAYREGVGEPVSAAITAGSLADAPGGGGVAGLLNPENYKQGYKIAQDRSPGQAFALAFTDNIKDPAEVEKMQATDAYRVRSGLFDAALRLRGDPMILIGKAKLFYDGTKILSTQAQIERATLSGRIGDLAAEFGRIPEAQIRSEYFPHHPLGAQITHAIASAEDQTGRVQALRVGMGATDELEQLALHKPAAAAELERLLTHQQVIREVSPDGFTLFNTAEEMAKTKTEINALYNEVDRLNRLDLVAGAIREVPKSTLVNRTRTAITRSDWYQSSVYAKPLHVVFDMEPHHLVNLDDQSGDVHLWRQMQKGPLPIEQQDALRAQYMEAMTPGDRNAIILHAENAQVKAYADKAGMTVDEVEQVMANAAKQRGTAKKALQGRIYDGENRSKIQAVGEDGRMVEYPLMVSQEANMLPLADMDAVRKATTKIGQWKARYPQTDIPVHLMENFMAVWRPSVLLRLGWPMRIVGDEQLRIMAKLGALAPLKHLNRGLRSKLGEPTNLVVDGYKFEGAFGAVGDGENIYKKLASSRPDWEVLYGKAEKDTLDFVRNSTGEWHSIDPTDTINHPKAWERAANLQIGQDELARKFLDGASVEDGATWLRSTAEGQHYARQLKMRKDYTAWSQSVKEQVDSYLPTEELKQLAKGRKATFEDLARAIPDPSARPIVHGEILAQATGKSQTIQLLQKMTDKAFHVLGSAPTDALSRNPFFNTMYQSEITRQTRLLGEGRVLDQAALDGIMQSSRSYALSETRELLYDLAEKSRLSEMLRFYMPFYSAWQEVITRWGGLIVENPAFARQMQLVWQAPDKMGIVEDEYGNVVDEHGRITDPVDGGGFTKGQVTPSSTRNITMRLPEWARDVPGLTDVGEVKFGKASFNLALQGAPGFGPLVQVAANEIAKSRPELEDSVGWALPYGTTQDTKDILMPAAARKFQTAVGGEEDRVYRNSALRIYYDKVVDYNLGKRDDKPTWKEAQADTDAFWNLRTFASYVSPAAPQFSSPYQPYIDALRSRRLWDAKLTDEQKRSPDYKTPDDWFLDQFGEEFFPLTQSLSKSVDGVPPTQEAYAARGKYKDLIEKHPELGRLIVGSEGAGEFSRAVYDSQLQETIRPGSDVKQRESQSFDEAESAPDVRLGWTKYMRAMDTIEALRVQKGLPNLQVKAAEPLAMLKQAMTASLAQKYPEWYNDFTVTDQQSMKHRLDGLREIAKDKRMQARPEMQGLAEYLKMRDVMATILKTRPSTTLTASANQDMAQAWASMIGVMVDRNPAFGDLYYRYLERDTLEA